MIGSMPTSDEVPGTGEGPPIFLATLASLALTLSGSASAGPTTVQDPSLRVLDEQMHHLGDDETPEWPEASASPEATRYELEFEAQANSQEFVLILGQRHVNDSWSLVLNGREVAQLERGDALRDVHYRLPPGTLVRGLNLLAVVPTTTTDDITVGRVRLVEASFRDFMDLGGVSLTVTDLDSGEPVPARVTVIDEAGELASLYYAESPRTAVRDGVLYVGEGRGHLELPRGRYTVYATRGMEWGLGQSQLVVGEGRAKVALGIRREVDTTGYVAADTHIHTLTHSGHGDSSVEERMITLAGEGVELAIATDHNHNTDYRPSQWATGMGEHFTSVTGNEVSTPNGHFNAFPLDPDDEVPAHTGSDWIALVDGMRAKGAKVIVLNHPRWPQHDTGPFGVFGLENATGRRASGPPAFTFDAMELVNSQTVEPEPMLLFEDWFGLLNRGERVFGAGSSDSHTVGGPVGGGRTYVPSATDDPAAIDVDAACDAMASGRSLVSMGIFVEATANGAPVGWLASAPEGRVRVTMRIKSASWVRPEQARVFANGVEVAARPVPTVTGESTDVTLDVDIDLEGGHDVWIACVVTGAGIQGPYWPIVNDYTLGATNPVWVDVDGDGVHSTPREVAAGMLAAAIEAGTELDGPTTGDAAVALQFLDLLEDELVARVGGALRGAGAGAAGRHGAVKRYLERRSATEAELGPSGGSR